MSKNQESRKENTEPNEIKTILEEFSSKLQDALEKMKSDSREEKKTGVAIFESGKGAKIEIEKEQDFEQEEKLKPQLKKLRCDEEIQFEKRQKEIA